MNVYIFNTRTAGNHVLVIIIQCLDTLWHAILILFVAQCFYSFLTGEAPQNSTTINQMIN